MSGHTPGPWAVLNTIDDECLLGFGIDNLESAFDVPPPWYSVWLRVEPADARLIAAAPELLEALIDCREALRRSGATGELAVVSAAIAKATGAAK